MKILLIFLISFNCFALTPAQYRERFSDITDIRHAMLKANIPLTGINRNPAKMIEDIIENDNATKLAQLETGWAAAIIDVEKAQIKKDNRPLARGRIKNADIDNASLIQLRGIVKDIRASLELE